MSVNTKEITPEPYNHIYKLDIMATWDIAIWWRPCARYEDCRVWVKKV